MYLWILCFKNFIRTYKELAFISTTEWTIERIEDDSNDQLGIPKSSSWVEKPYPQHLLDQGVAIRG